MLKLVIKFPHLKEKQKKQLFDAIEKALKSNDPIDRKTVKAIIDGLDDVSLIPDTIDIENNKVSLVASKIKTK